MGKLRIYEIRNSYIDYLSDFAPHLFQNKKTCQKNERKFIGVILEINSHKYFAPLSSFKPKHKHMRNSCDFIKIKEYAVINLNNMFPVPDSEVINFDIQAVSDMRYRALLQREFRFIKSMESQIIMMAEQLYRYKLEKGNSTSLAKRCNDFRLLETKATEFNEFP